MRLSLHYRGKLIHINFDKEEIRVRDILDKLNLSRDYAFVIVNGEIAAEDQIVSEQDDIRVINAISGG
ncbi:MoaD/ThiS family protein [Thermocrinis sp.]